MFSVGSQMGKSLIGGADMFFKKTVAYCLTILVLLVPIFISVQTAVPAVFADEVAGPEELGCGVSRQSFTYGGQTFSNWDLSSYFPDTIKNFLYHFPG